MGSSAAFFMFQAKLVIFSAADLIVRLKDVQARLSALTEWDPRGQVAMLQSTLPESCKQFVEEACGNGCALTTGGRDGRPSVCKACHEHAVGLQEHMGTLWWLRHALLQGAAVEQEAEKRRRMTQASLL